MSYRTSFSFLPPCLCALPLLVACGSDASSDSSGDAGASGGASSCTSTEYRFDHTIEQVASGTGSTTQAIFYLGEPQVDEQGFVWPAAMTREGGVDLYLLSSDQEEPRKVASLDDRYAQSIDMVGLRLGERACVLFDDANLSLACDDGTVEDSAIRIDGDHMLPIVHPDGSLSVYTQTFAAYTEVTRSSAGQWGEVEKYESSISWPSDIVARNGQAVSCFISSGDHAVVGELLRSTDTASQCWLAGGAEELHVLTDKGYTTIPWDQLGGFAEGSFTVDPSVVLEQRPFDFVAIDEEPYAIVLNPETLAVEAQSLLDGIRHPIADHGAKAVRIPGANALLVADTSIDNSSEPAVQTLRFSTICDEEWRP